ncbi:hypothetical protein [Candidatus Nitrosacidococcus tergens]|uniref:Nucleic acid-binding domain protein n=1 Tax=Candidatus Nitrosacidococcus tergens TaxID=553981 RepID=A0A7G1Q7B8_9GAMM
MCGVLKQVKQAFNQMYLNLDNPYPKQNLSTLVWNDDYPKFQERFGNLNQFVNTRVCARGLIVDYKDSLQINVKNPQFFRIMK